MKNQKINEVFQKYYEEKHKELSEKFYLINKILKMSVVKNGK